MEKLEKLYEGKAKKLYATDDPDVLWVEYMNQATAGNGEKKAQIEGKGSLNNRITSVIFDLLKARGVDSHFVRRISETEQLVKKMDMYPLEIIMRNTAAGSFAKRYGVEEGTELKKPILEFCLKSDALGDPFINEDGIVALGLADEDEIAEISRQARAVNAALLDIFAKIDVKLVDFKIEEGKTSDGRDPARRRDHPRHLPPVGTRRITAARSSIWTRTCSAGIWATSSPRMRRSTTV